MTTALAVQSAQIVAERPGEVPPYPRGYRGHFRTCAASPRGTEYPLPPKALARIGDRVLDGEHRWGRLRVVRRSGSSSPSGGFFGSLASASALWFPFSLRAYLLEGDDLVARVVRLRPTMSRGSFPRPQAGGGGVLRQGPTRLSA